VIEFSPQISSPAVLRRNHRCSSAGFAARLTSLQAPQLDFGFYASPQGRNIITGPLQSTVHRCQKKETPTYTPLPSPYPISTLTIPRLPEALARDKRVQGKALGLKTTFFNVSSRLVLQSFERQHGASTLLLFPHRAVRMVRVG
jgi:hypothetical protein